MNAEAMFNSVVEALVVEPGVTKAKMFGAPGLRVGSKFFGCLVSGKLVVKLPQNRVEALIASGDGERFYHRFDPGTGRVMREWVAVPPVTNADWIGLAKEARDFVASGQQ